MILKLFIWLGWSGVVVAAPTTVVLAALGCVTWTVFTAIAALVLVLACRRAEDSLGEWSSRQVDREWKQTASPQRQPGSPQA